MFTTNYVEPTGGDSMASYSVKFTSDITPTVAEFIDHVLMNRPAEWGIIKVFYYNRFHNPKDSKTFQYSHGTKVEDNIPEEWKQMRIVNASAFGGYTRMDYDLELPKLEIS